MRAKLRSCTTKAGLRSACSFRAVSAAAARLWRSANTTGAARTRLSAPAPAIASTRRHALCSMIKPTAHAPSSVKAISIDCGCPEMRMHQDVTVIPATARRVCADVATA